jgi:transcriptional regulator with XRE-family HTH domain
MRRTPRNAAPQGFIDLLQELMQKRGISLNQVAEQAGMSPAFLSRILNRKRGIPSDRAILRLAQALDLRPPERLLIEAGRIPQDLKPALSNPQMPALLRATEKLSESDLQQVLRTVQALAVKHHRREGSA